MSSPNLALSKKAHTPLQLVLPDEKLLESQLPAHVFRVDVLHAIFQCDINGLGRGSAKALK